MPTNEVEIVLVDAGSGPSGLDRVVSTCRTRRCHIESLSYEAAVRRRKGRLRLVMSGTQRQLRLALARVEALPQVLDVTAATEPLDR
jgi:acetolactate synthase small subunit